MRKTIGVIVVLAILGWLIQGGVSGKSSASAAKSTPKSLAERFGFQPAKEQPRQRLFAPLPPLKKGQEQMKPLHDFLNSIGDGTNNDAVVKFFTSPEPRSTPSEKQRMSEAEIMQIRRMQQQQLQRMQNR